MLHIRIFIFIILLSTMHLCAQENVKWYTIEQALELSSKAPRKIVIDVYTDWCGWCKTMDQKTFSNSTIAQFMNEKYYPVKFNAEQKADIIIKSDTLSFVPSGSRGYHELAYALLNGQLGYPAIVFLDENIRNIHVQKGYTEAKEFDQILKFIGNDIYKSEKWDTWVASYQSPIH